jgi:hypothetical protein
MKLSSTKNRFLAVVMSILVGLFGAASAHKASDSYLKIQVKTNTLEGQWDIALRDLDYAIGLDRNDDGAITWGELKAQEKQIESYALSKLTLTAGKVVCALEPKKMLVDNHTDGAYAVLNWKSNCSSANLAAGLTLDYRFLADLDPQHRGLLSLTSVAGQNQTFVFSPTTPSQTFSLEGTGTTQTGFLEFIRQGVWHIWQGIDHILFLLALLLPSVLRRENGRWVSVADFKSALLSVVKIVTAFTLAHSITLSLAALQIIALPSRLVESLIAASVVLAALNNVWPVVKEGRRWLVAFGFGLIHGFGFASVLTDLALPRNSLLSALLGFNVGVEIGQMVIVLIFLPLAFLLRSSVFYRRMTFVGGSLVVAVIAATWMAERVLDFKVLPF